MITPLDIENKRFTKKMKGYSTEEVDDFLDELTLEYGKIYKENGDLLTLEFENRSESNEIFLMNTFREIYGNNSKVKYNTLFCGK